MQLVSPESIRNSRAYFTEFDRVTYSQVAWTDDDLKGIRTSVERKLKLIALTKGHVVIAASHLLESELAQAVLFPYPRLFSQGVVVPALRSEHGTFTQFLDAKISEGMEADHYEGTDRRDMAQMLDSESALVVRWSASLTSDWFKRRLVSDLEDESSLLRSCLRSKGGLAPPGLTAQIEAVQTLSRKDIYLLAKGTGDKVVWDTLSNYADFLYYLSGARAVCSEGVLPQENLMDFSLSDLAGGRTRLSEREVFFKVFVDLIKTATRTHFPVDMLDALSMEDVIDLNRIGVEEGFTERYNEVQEKAKEGLRIRDPERLVLHMDELEQFERQLHSEYRSAIDRELPRFLKNRRKPVAARMLNAVASLLVPVWGAAQGMGEIVISGLEFASKRQLVAKIKEQVQLRLVALSKLIERVLPSEKAVLLTFYKRMQRRYAAKMD